MNCANFRAGVAALALLAAALAYRWARELGRSGIRVNAVAPGFTLTEMVKQVPENILQNMIAHTPLQRLGEPRDVANAYLFLASEEASFINGVILRVDGGIVVGT